MSTAAALRDAGIEAAADHADAVEPRWTDRAFDFAVDVLAARARKGKNDPFMTEDVRKYAVARGFPEPPDARAWGAVMIRARRKGLIVRVGTGDSKNPQAHLRPTNQWRMS